MSTRRGRRQQNRARSKAPEKRAPTKFDIGVVLVHGIGPNRPGKTLARWSPEIEHALGALPSGRTLDSVDASMVVGDSKVPTRELTLTRGEKDPRRILVTEACWSEEYQPRRLVGSLPWLARVVPALVIPFMPDSRDTPALRSPQPYALAMVALRFLVRLAVIPLAAVLLFQFPIWVRITIICAILMVLAICLISRRANLAGHVLMAATDGPELIAVEKRIDQTILACKDAASEVIVVAHSQGAFLSHRVLEQRGHRVRLICVGSGLRPITLLRVLGRRPYNLAAVVALAGMVSLSVAFAGSVHDGPAIPNSIRQQLLSNFFSLLYGISSRQASHAPSFSDALEALPRVSLSWWLAVAIVLYASALVAVRQWGPQFLEATRIKPLQVASWLELSSRHDLVGRLTVPNLPAPAIEAPVVVTGNPLADHLYYFRRDNVTVWLVAVQLLKMLGVSTTDNPEIARGVAVSRSERRHWLRIASLGMPVLVIATVGALLNQNWTIQALGPVVPAIAALAFTVSISTVAVEVRDSRRIASDLPDLLVKKPNPGRLRERVIDTTLLGIAGMFNLLSAVVLQQLFGPRTSALAGTYAAWAVVQIGLSVFIVAGYRPGGRIALILALAASKTWIDVESWQPTRAELVRLQYPPGAFLWEAGVVLTVIGFIGIGRWASLWRRLLSRLRR